MGHLKALETQLRKYFISNIDFKKLSWIQKPFLIGLSEIDYLPYKAREKFAELSSDSNLKLDFHKKPLNKFWIGTRIEFPTISDMAFNVLLPFNTTYLRESTFSALTHIKSQYCSWIKNVEGILHPAVSNIAPKFNLLSRKKQAHPSHLQTICYYNQLTTALFVIIINSILQLFVQFLILHFCMF